MDGKQRIVETTARLLWSQGLAGTGMKQIIRESGLPRGSVYFHFPEGKEQLVDAAVRASGSVITENIRTALGHRNTRTAIRKYAQAFSKELEASDFQRGCPIATVALEAASSSPTIRATCAEIFGEWQSLLEERLARDGVPRRRAKETAVFILSAIEGGLLLCRTQRSTAPLRSVARQFDAILAE